MHIISSYEKKNDRKYCLQLKDGVIIEAALFEHRNAIHFCIPTQVGCNMGCKHCSTTYAPVPYIRNLSSIELNEMIEMMRNQLWNKRLPWVLSFSGHGEPMLNWNNIQKCVDICHNEFSNIYITSIGFIHIMKRILLKSDFYPSIYFSIHGSSDNERTQLIPSAQSQTVANLQQIIDFGRLYTQQSGRVVWNYMLCNINSTIESFQQLLKLCECVDYPLELRFTKYIDICKNNNIQEIEDNIIRTFYQKFLEQAPSNIHIRLSSLEGEEMGIACGQMRASMQKM